MLELDDLTWDGLHPWLRQLAEEWIADRDFPSPVAASFGRDGIAHAILFGPLFCAEDSASIIDTFVTLFRALRPERVAVAWPCRFESDDPSFDDIRSIDGGLWTLKVTTGERTPAGPLWATHLIGYRWERWRVVDWSQAEDIGFEEQADPYPRQLQAILAADRDEAILARPLVDLHEEYALYTRPGFGFPLVPVPEEEVARVDGQVWRRSQLA